MAYVASWRIAAVSAVIGLRGGITIAAAVGRGRIVLIIVGVI